MRSRYRSWFRMYTRTLALVAALAAGGALAGILHLQAAPTDAVAYPQGFRKWTHVKSVLVGPQSRFFARVGGLHHIYANEQSMKGYTSGKFPDGSVLVFDLFETRETAGSILEGPRRFIDVMEKDSKRFAATAGWGYEEFKGDSKTERALNAEAVQKCHACHQTAKDHDAVFSRFRE